MLTIIALALVLIACNQYVYPVTTVQAQGLFGGVQFTGPQNGYVFFDTRTGDMDLWSGG